MRPNKAKDAYNDHKNRAKRIGIDFQFSFEEWRLWWEKHLGPDWLRLRGRRRGQYVMARYNDIGPYHPANVKCVLHGKNLSEAKPQRGENHGRAKLTKKQVLDIRSSAAKHTSLARSYGVSHTTIRGIRNRRIWRHI